MLYVAQTALELGFQYALVAMALFLSYRVLDIADLTTDGCFVLGCAVSVTLTAAGHPFLAIPAAMLAGACAGFVTAFLQTKLGVPSILAGIVTNTGLYTVNLMAMGWKANQSLLKQDTIFTLFRATGIGGDWNPILLSGGITVLGQAQKTADINNGTGIVVIGLACLIIGETIVGRGAMFRGAIAVVAGSILYRLVYALVLYTKVVPVDCLKLVTALVVALAIAAPSIRQWWAFQTRKRRALAGRKGEK